MDEKKLYLSDDPIDEIKDDKFHHAIYADILLKIIKDVKSPFNIGLFGRWGTGKTSIIKFLIQKIDEIDEKNKAYQKITYFEFDVWKYADDSLREQILLELNKKFKKYKTQDIKDELFCIKEEYTSPKSKSTWEQIKHIFSQTYVFLITFCLVLMAGVLLSLEGINAFNGLVVLLLIPLFFSLIKKIDSAALSMARKQTMPIREAPSQFEEIFKSIVNSMDDEKLVLIIDNLDRCPSKTVIEMLGMIKSFMNVEKCIYVIPCDDKALRKHLMSVKGKDYLEEDAQEYLQKFFQTAISIPEFLEENIEKFANDLNSELKYSFEENVIDVVKSAYTKNPRRIKYALNKLTTLKLLAKEKEIKGIVRNGVITEKFEFLAKISIIEEEWPDFYQELLYNEGLLEETENHLRGFEDSEQIKEFFENKKGLKEFLNATRLITVDDLTPFLKLCQTTYDVKSAQSETIKKYILTNNVYGFSQILNESKNEEEKESYIKIILDTLDNTHRTNRYQIRFNCLFFITEVYDQIPDKIKTDVLSKFAINIDIHGMKLCEFEPSNLFKVIKCLKSKSIKYILSKYIECVVVDGKMRNNLLDQFIQHHEIVPNNVKDILSEKTILPRLKSNPDDKIALDIINSISSSNAKSKLISQNVVKKLITQIGRKPDLPEQNGLDLYLKLKDIADRDNKEYFVNKQFELIAGGEEVNNAITINNKIITNLSNLNEDEIPKSIIEGTYTKIIELTANLNIDQRLEYYLLILKHFNKLSEKSQNDFINQHLHQVFSGGDEHSIISVLNIIIENKLSILEDNTALQTLQQRIISTFRSLNIVALLIKGTPENKLKEITQWIIQLINHTDFPVTQAVIGGFSQAYESFNKSQIYKICNHCLDATEGRQIEQRMPFLNAVSSCFEKCTPEIKEKLVDNIIFLFKSESPDWSTRANEVYRLISSKMTDELKAHMASKVIEKLNSIEVSILGNYSTLFELIISLEKETQKDDWISFLNLISKMISNKQPEKNRIHGFNYIKKIDNFSDKYDEILNQVLQTISDTPVLEEVAKQALTHLKEKSENNLEKNN